MEDNKAAETIRVMKQGMYSLEAGEAIWQGRRLGRMKQGSLFTLIKHDRLASHEERYEMDAGAMPSEIYISGCRGHAQQIVSSLPESNKTIHDSCTVVSDHRCQPNPPITFSCTLVSYIHYAGNTLVPRTSYIIQEPTEVQRWSGTTFESTNLSSIVQTWCFTQLLSMNSHHHPLYACPFLFSH